MNTIAIIQARMSSSRLPGKVLQPIAGKSMLELVIERSARARLINGVIVATSANASDDPIEALCKRQGIACYRGSMHDVLDRFYLAAQSAQAEEIVRITADCPLIDPGLIDTTLLAFREGADFAANRLPPPWRRSFPIGLDVEVCIMAALRRAWKEAGQKYQREHVMPYLYEGVVFEDETHLLPFGEQQATGTIYVSRGLSAHGFRATQLHHSPDYGSMRWTVDTPADLELVRQIYARFPGRSDFTWQEVLAVFEREPELAMINADTQHKTAFDVDERAKFD